MQKAFLRHKIFLIPLGLLSSIIFLEITIRLGGFVFSYLQESRNLASIRQKGAYRIMCLGESTTAGGQYPYPSQLEEVLNQRNIGIKFSVINKGESGINTKYILSHLEENINRYKPDMVIAMMGDNDGGIKYYEGISGSDTLLFHKFRTYRLIRIMWKDFMDKLKKAGFYKPKGNKRDLTLATQENPYTLKQAGSFQAVKTAKKPTELDFSDPKRYVSLGNVYTKEERFSEAEEAFKKAIELNPNDENAYSSLGKFYNIRLGRFAEAEEAFKKALELNPNNDSAYTGLGDIYDRHSRPKEAEAAFKKAIALNPGNSEAYRRLGSMYLVQSKYILAEESFKKAIDINPLDGNAYRGAALLCEAMGEYDSAQEYFKKADSLREQYYNPLTLNSYHKAKEILDKIGIKLVCMQYPMRNVESLKKMFEPQEQERITFIDNEKIFKDALKKTNPNEYFLDLFAGDFGHCTHKGNRLIAENVAKVILKEVFHK